MKNVVLTDAQVRSGIHEIMRAMKADGWYPDVIVGISKGGLIPAVLLSNYLHLPMVTLDLDFENADYSPASSYSLAEDAFGYGKNHQKNILVVNDINDSGKTFNWLVEDWQKSCLPDDPKWKDIWNQNVRFAVLVDNNNSGFSNIDYSMMDVDTNEESQIIVFPWEVWWTA